MSLSLYIGITGFIIVLYIVTNIYIPKRLCSLFEIRKTRVFVGLFTLMGVLVIASTASKPEAGIFLSLFKLLNFWIGLVIYLFLFLICYEFIQRFIKVDKKKVGVGIIGLSLTVMTYGIWNARDYEVTHVEIPIENLSEKVRIFHIPDIHLGPFRGKELLQKLIDDIKRLEPDLVLINGDLVDNAVALNPDTLKLLRDVKRPVYFTSGNHDNNVDIQYLKALLTQYRVRVLNNEIVNIRGIQLVGLDYMNADDNVYDAHASTRSETIKSVLPALDIDPGIPSVIVHHSAVGIKYMLEAGADLVLSGHTHAGQFFPITLIARIQFPYLKGLYTNKNTKIYVNQGIGTFGPPIRIGTKGEAALITLVRSHNQN